jgi:hypothetical protein
MSGGSRHDPYGWDSGGAAARIACGYWRCGPFEPAGGACWCTRRRGNPKLSVMLAARGQAGIKCSVLIGSSWLISGRRSSQWGGIHMCVPSSSSDSSIKNPFGVE